MARAVFTNKVTFFNIAYKVTKYLECFVAKFVANNFQKSANLVTLVRIQIYFLNFTLWPIQLRPLYLL